MAVTPCRGAEFILLALDAELCPSVVMAEAPHGTAPALWGKNVANPMAMVLACAAVLDYAGRAGDDEAASAATAATAATAIRTAALGAAADGVRTTDLGGNSSTTEVLDEIVMRVARSIGADEPPDSPVG